MTLRKHFIGVAAALAGLCAAIPMLGLGEPPSAPTTDSRPGEGEARSLPERVTARLGTNRLRRPELFTSVAYSPDGSTLASASYQGTVRLWDAAGGSERMLLQEGGADKGGQLVVFSPDGKWLAASDLSSAGSLWELRKGQRPRAMAVDVGGAQAMAFSPDGALLAIGYRGCLAVKEVATGKELFESDAEGGVAVVAFSPDGKLLASAADLDAINRATGDPAIRLRDPSTGKVVAKLEGHTGCILSLAFTPDGKTLASSSYDDTIRIWNVAKRETIRQIHTPVDRIAFSPDGKKLATAGTNNGKVRFFDPGSGELLLEISGVPTFFLKSLSFSPDGKRLAVAGGSSAIQIWDTTTGDEESPEGHLDSVGDVVFSADGKTLASRGGDRSVRLWDLAKRKQKRVFSHGSGQFAGGDIVPFPCCLALTPDAKTVACIGGYRGDAPVVCAWDTSSGKLAEFAEPRHPPLAVAISPDGDTMATICDYGLHLRSLATGKEIGLLPHFGGPAVFLPDGKTLLAGGDNYDIFLVDCRTLYAVRTTATAEPCIAVSPDGRAACHLWTAGRNTERAVVGPGPRLGDSHRQVAAHVRRQ